MINVVTIRGESKKRTLIERLSAQQKVLTFLYDEPPSEELEAEIVSDFVTFIRPPYDYDLLHDWLYLGNWQAICGNTSFPAIKEFPIDVEVEQKMNQLEIDLVINSFF